MKKKCFSSIIVICIISIHILFEEFLYANRKLKFEFISYFSMQVGLPTVSFWYRNKCRTFLCKNAILLKALWFGATRKQTIHLHLTITKLYWIHYFNICVLHVMFNDIILEIYNIALSYQTESKLTLINTHDADI